jgi:CRP-like cAMP-binding protein
VKSGEILCEPTERIQRVYFPTTAYISLIAPALGTESLEVGMVGNEGMFGITVLLDVKTSPLTGFVQGAGQALLMSAGRFSQLANDVAPFKKIVHRYLYVLTAQLAQTAACNRFHSLDSRLARWLLMTRDRAQSDTFRLTHKSLAYMLGVRRAGVTEAAGRLQAKKLIRYHHGEITVLDRYGLEESACSCYIAHNAVYEEHLGKPRVASVQPTTHRVL